MPDRIRITSSLSLPESALEISYVRSSGPGGQHVNKVATAAQLRFDLEGAPLPDGLKRRAATIAGTRLTNDGAIVMTASGSRSQAQNREEVVARLVDLLRQAAIPPKHRVKTRPTLGAKRRRMDAKSKRGAIKKLRSGKPSLD